MVPLTASATPLTKHSPGATWKSTQSFGRNDLLLLAKVADQAHSRIVQLALPDGAAASPEDSPES